MKDKAIMKNKESHWTRFLLRIVQHFLFIQNNVQSSMSNITFNENLSK